MNHCAAEKWTISLPVTIHSRSTRSSRTGCAPEFDSENGEAGDVAVRIERKRKPVVPVHQKEEGIVLEVFESGRNGIILERKPSIF